MEVITIWQQEFNRLMQRLKPQFARSQSRGWARAYLQGLLSHIGRKNSWQIAESLGETSPYGLQQFLYRAKWDAGQVRDELRAYVVEHLADPEAVLVVDESGFMKKGEHSAGVQVQYCGRIGRTTNCQVGVFLTYASRQGHTFLDRALYLPQSWTDDRARCREAGIADEVAFATKPELALQMLKAALAAGVPAAWVTGDSVYGNGMLIRGWLEQRPIGYVMAVSRNETIISSADGYPHRVSEYLDNLPTEGWQRLSAGEGSKGPRWYDWLRLPLYDLPPTGWQRWLLVRRSLTDPTDLTAYVCFAPADTALAKLVQVAGTRWTVEQCFEMAKQEAGLDEYEVRSYTGWYRHITLACLAHAFLTVLRAQGLDPLDLCQKKTPPTRPSSLATFKAKRGLISL
jgi:SRSO17 transposase